MPKFESTSAVTNPETNNVEAPSQDIKQRESQEQESEKLKLSPEEQLDDIEDEIKTRQQEITMLSGSIESTKSKMNEAREKLGLPPNNEEQPSILADTDRLEQLRDEQDDLEKEKTELISQQEREQLIHREIENILQERINDVFKAFQNLNPRDFESIFNNGKTSEGKNFQSESIGSLDPEIAQSLAKTFKEGVKLLPQILEAFPDLFKKLEEDLEKEARERVDKKLEEEKRQIEDEEEDEREEKPKVPEAEIQSIEVAPEINPVENADLETPQV